MRRTYLAGILLLSACSGIGRVGLEAHTITDRSDTPTYSPSSAGARLLAVQVTVLNATAASLPVRPDNFLLESTTGTSLAGHSATIAFDDPCAGALAPSTGGVCSVGFDVPRGFVPAQIVYEHMSHRAVAPIGSDGGVDFEYDAGPPPPPPSSGQLDMLFMVDNSNSMLEEQASLTAEFPRLVNILVSGDFDQDGDGPGDGEENDEDFEPITDLHVGIITSDMGTGGFTVPTCANSDFGDDGIMHTEGDASIAGCIAGYPSFLAYRGDGGSSPADFVRDLSCVATVGTGGCGFEQQLESILKALSPSSPTAWTREDYEAPAFFRSTLGHADANNDGFVRQDSVLAIIAVTDEEDCSARDPELFNPSSATYGATDLNLRCFAHADTGLHPIGRFVDGLIQLRRHPNRLVFAPIVGIPADLEPPPGASPNFAVLVSEDPAVRDDRMEERVDAAMPSRLIPSCDVLDRGRAFPPVRIVRVAQGLDALGAGVTVQSICQESFQNPLLEVVRRIRAAGEGG